MIERAAENKLWAMRNMASLRKKHGNKFVACDRGRVLAVGDSLAEVLRKLRKRRIDPMTVAIEFIPEGAVWLLEKVERRV